MVVMVIYDFGFGGDDEDGGTMMMMVKYLY